MTAAHEDFCRNIVAGMEAARAYLTAGFKSKTGAATMMKRPEIIERIGVLRALARRRATVTIDQLVEHYYEAMALARATENAGAYVSAVTALGKMLGLIIEKTEVDHFLIPKPALRPGTDVLLTPDEWAAQWAPRTIEHQTNGHGNGAQG